ncbi:homeotic protein female sterile [Drosophila obscura]|uniref:homeotic protein female sterile n=1 Tax=Drosophila obscura TaxID=7282 RepID=UPI001BB27651|nr:homeotic protein female sterile [Drosophila obscura]XP_022225644.2 homeotic protein female sterile [Drosophila obscura]XP_022225645.2 homeotic protein female sterile [Drosophila obscura]XP_022225646.2 homeotic protein female sterile [Drosophila obscura]XP_022225647.2 homeotic protein female sterile [Drosophila obscura]
MPSVKSPKSEILPGIIRSDSPCHSYRLRSTSTSNSSMTNDNSLRLRLLLLSNIFGLLSWTQALPFEYLDEHDDFNYDLDTAQSQAKYDARLLSQQMLSDAELLQQAEGTGPHTVRPQGGLSDGSVEDLEPHSRAAACFTNGHKYTHGQKVPRQDACEVCLCMDGEIFCWWERCDKANANKVKATAAGNANDNANDNGKGKGKGGGFGVGFGFGGGNGDGDGAAAAVGVGDYSDPYRYESSTRKSTKVHKTAGKVGKRRNHRRNQKNFNDYEVFHSHKQQQQQPTDYKKSPINQKQQQQRQQHEHQIQKQKNGDATNYNIIKQHKHEQHQKVAETQQQELEHEQDHSLVASTVNQAAAKETHYQQPATTTPSHQQEEEEQQQHQQQKQKQHSSHPQRPQHSSSKILNFPENLPALLYYDYKTEEHEHHQHQHHQQHLLHEKQRLQHQQEALARQKPPADAVVELHTDLGVDKNFDEAETDSDILPEPPTKRPKATAPTQWTTSSSPRSSMAKASMTNQAATSTTVTTTTMTTTGTNAIATGRLSSQDSGGAKAGYGATVAATNLQPDKSGGKDLDDAFHRWLTSTELNADSTNTPDDASEQETAASTIIDDVAISNKSDSGTRGNGSGSGSGSGRGGSSKDNARNNVADAVFFRSSYNDYSSEFNGSVVNIDITLTAVDVHPRRQTDLIANGNRTSCVSTVATPGIAETPETTAGTTMDKQANDRRSTVPVTSSSSISTPTSDNQDQPLASGSPVVAPYTLTTIITTTPLAPGRMCNVLGKLYKIGDILPQDTGNCLQCICTDAVTPDEMPSVTCSPHNCPPLVLPDLFDATGY